MITERTIVSARAEDRRDLARRRVKRILTASLAAVLILPSLAAWGTEGQTGKANPYRFDTIALPPIPSLDSVPWLKWKTGLKVDTLLSPVLDPSGIKLEPDERDTAKPAVS
jgi:hypothetical protein